MDIVSISVSNGFGIELIKMHEWQKLQILNVKEALEAMRSKLHESKETDFILARITMSWCIGRLDRIMEDEKPISEAKLMRGE